ncbi:FtsK/SpoIIIE domain-containing protein [Streptomyces sp. H10-C2]|uniref:FtsK/SpoIIIE domain-containing protein n=1 Tax=unclassified Streptomyces TaxID=2593676 RepID=UPI0024BAB740|nr:MULTISPECIES: FtsK/SpoIIIE domain-containing protein [unclassified Streptomyces]MDJ0343357.1 FtsK/SpoIIIE domain-containing protein [Streptomyces sp. PH10-H1]MDJ0371832.1 FtsK/SpoIIIE domain-containing protein [Streptomyces sp. H10-C2]
MRLFLSITSADDPVQGRDFVLDATGATTVGALASRLAAGGQDPGRPGGAEPPALYLGDRELPAGLPLSAAGVRDGARLGLGGPTAPEPGDYGPLRAQLPPPSRSADGERLPRGPRVELQLVGGRDAGRVWLLEPGTHAAGPQPGSAVFLEGRDVPSKGVRITVRPDGTVLLNTGQAEGVALSAPEPPPARPRADATPLPPAPPPELPDPDADAHEPLPRGWQEWPIGDELVMGEFLLRVAEPTEADAAVTDSVDGAFLDFNRPPRIIPPLVPERFVLPSPPGPPTRRPIPLLVVVAPLFFGVGMVTILHSYFYLMFAFFSPVLAIGNWLSGRRSGRREYLDGVASYRARRGSLEQDVQQKVGRERRLRVAGGPDPATAGLWAVGPGARLWERRRGHPDHLVLRVGTVGQSSLLTIEDTSREDNHRSVNWRIPDMPVGVDLAGDGVVGIAGERDAARALARWTVAQAAILHSPRDVRITVLTDAAGAAAWEWVRWLPHARPGQGGISAQNSGGPSVTVGNDPETVANRVSELVAAVRSRMRARDSAMSGALLSEPDLVVVLDGARQLRDVPGVVQVLKEGPAVRVFLICLDQEERMLPEECVSVCVVGARDLTLRRTGSADLTGIRPDLVDTDWCERTARALAPVRDVTPDGSDGLPDRVDLLGLLELEPPRGEEIARRWTKRPASTTALLGVGYTGPVAFDLIKDGPHGLVAGTTGAGKSELLQTLVASLAAVNRPDEMTFVLVDYKGGSAFQDCVRLPHVLGMVTDLDSHLVERALASLGAELTRRERILAQAGAKDHIEYRAMRRRDPSLATLPRLLLIIDEFATLARDVQEFVPGLVSIAQRGRSLGLHLILATQRPAGVVTADIRANTNLRIALRVTDGMDSQDVLEVNDAVTISAGTPGRALARIGHRSVLPFQTAFVGAARTGKDDAGQPRPAGAAAPGVEMEGRPAAEPPVWTSEVNWALLGRMAAEPGPEHASEGEEAVNFGSGSEAPTDETDLTALVEAVREAAAELSIPQQPSPWLPALPQAVSLHDLPERPDLPGGRLAPVPWALADLPGSQRQEPLELDFSHFGHLYILGTPRSGRSQALRTIGGALARRHSSADVHLYGIDAAGGALAALSALPHCGAVVPRTDLERLNRLLARLIGEMGRRQELLTAHGVANLAELRTLLPAAERPAHVVVLIDGWDSLTALLGDHDGGRPVQELTALIREGAPMGVHVIATSERALLSGKVASLNDERLLLRLTDRSEYMLAGIPAKLIPAVVPQGRGWRGGSATEVQVALLGEPSGGLPTGRDQAEALQRIGADAARRDQGVPAHRRPARVMTLPRQVSFTEAYAKVPTSLRRPLWGLLGIGGDDLEPVGVDFAADAPSFLISGPPGAGRSTALASLAVSLLAGGTRVVVITPRESPLRGLRRHPQAVVLESPDPMADEVREALESGSGPAVVLVDDADLLAQMPAADSVLRDIAATGRDRGYGLAVAATAETLTSAGIGWLGQVRRVRKGVLLSPQSPAEGDLLGIRVPYDLLRGRPTPGRGLTVDPVSGLLVSVLVPETVLRSDDSV